jgi:hypothetical protein
MVGELSGEVKDFLLESLIHHTDQLNR